jgi:hypothetical protein
MVNADRQVQKPNLSLPCQEKRYSNPIANRVRRKRQLLASCQVTLLDIPADSVRWTGDGRSLLYSSTQGGASNVWERPIAGGAAKQLTHFTSETSSLFDLSKGGKQLAIQRDTSSSNVVVTRDVK